MYICTSCDSRGRCEGLLTEGCKPPDMRAGNLTRVLCKTTTNF